MEKTNEATPRPWYIDFEYWPRLILGSTDKQVADCEYIKDAELIVKAVNAYDSLVAENERLNNQLKTVTKAFNDENDSLQAENQKLREALKDIVDDWSVSNKRLSDKNYNKAFAILTKAKNV
jgi:regulator of replication initiation timing